MSLLHTVNQYANGARILADWLGGGGVSVDKELAQARGNVCIGCEMNQDGGAVTKEIANAIREQSELRNKLQMRINGQKKLKQCQVCSCQTSLKIWLPLENIVRYMDKNELLQFPAHCWLRTETNQ